MANELKTTSNSSIQVTVLIAGRPYLLKVNPADEATIYRLAQEINQKVAALQSSYTSRDLQDCFALALLTYAMDHHRASRSAPAAAPAELQR